MDTQTVKPDINAVNQPVSNQLGLPVNAFAIDPVNNQPKKKSRIKAVIKGFFIFFISVIVLGTIALFTIPIGLNLIAEDIPPINDKDVLPKIIVIDNKDNAFFDLNEIQEKVFETDSVKDYITYQKWDDRDVQQILDKNKELFDKWDSAVKKNGFQDPYYQDSQIPASFKSTMPHFYIKYQSMARLNVLQGLSLIKQGKLQEGIDEIFEILEIGQKLQDSGSGLVSGLVGISIKAIGYNGLQTAIANLQISQNDIAKYINRLDSYPFKLDGLKEGFKHEYFDSAYFIDYLASGKPLPSPSIGDEYVNLQVNLASKSKYFFEPNKTKQLYSDLTRNNIKNVELPCVEPIPNVERESIYPDNFIELFSKVFLNENGLGEALFYFGYTSYGGLRDNAVCSQAIELTSTKLILALRAYQIEKKSLPSSLDQLVPSYINSVPLDPYDNKPLKYSSIKKIIYSVGKNKSDEDGIGTLRSIAAEDYVVSFNF